MSIQVGTNLPLKAHRPYYRYSWTILVVLILAYFVDVFMRYNIPTVIPTLMKNYHWDTSTVGWVDSSYLWAYAIMQVPWGYVSEKWLGARWTITLGTILIAFASVLFALDVHSLGLAIFARALIGAGAAGIWVPANPMLARWFAPSHRGLQLGLLGMGSPLGTFVGGALMPILVTGVSLFGLPNIQSGFLLSAIPGIIMIIIVPLVVKNRPEDIGMSSLDTENIPEPQVMNVPEDEGPSFGYIMSHSWYPYLTALVYAGFLGTLYFVYTWFATYLGKTYLLDVKKAGLIWAICVTIPALVSQPVSGWIADRMGHKKTASVALLLTAIFSAVFIAIASLGKDVPLGVTIVVMLILALFVNMWVLIWPFTTIMFPTKAGGSIGGFMNTIAQLVGAAAPVISGYIIQGTNSYVGVFVLGTVCALIGLVGSLFLKERRVI